MSGVRYKYNSMNVNTKRDKNTAPSRSNLRTNLF